MTARDEILAAQAHLGAALAQLPAPGPPLSSPPGFWPVASAQPDPQSASKVQAAIVNGGAFYFSAGVGTAQAVDGPTYSVTTKEKDANGKLIVLTGVPPFPPATKPGCTNDALFVGTKDGQRYSFSSGTTIVNGKVTGCTGATITPAGAFTEAGPGSTSAARLPFGYISPAQVAAMTPELDGALTFSTMNPGHGAALYPANTAHTDFAGNGLGLPVGSWIGVRSLAGCPAKTPLELYHSARLALWGGFLRDQGSTFMWYLTDQSNQGGQVKDWAAVGVTFTSSTPSGVPYALPFSSAYVTWLKANLTLFQPPVAA